jgi:hypothetical protein
MGAILFLLIVGCSPVGRFPKSVEAELIAAAIEHNDQVRGGSGPYLDEVSGVIVVLAVTPPRREIDNYLSHIDHFWCATIKISGYREGEPASYESEWFAIRSEGSPEWNLMPRHLVSYPYIYDLLCEASEP